MMSAPDDRPSCGFTALTVAAVPTGIKAGVRISPRIAIVPVRAAPSGPVEETGHFDALLATGGPPGQGGR